MRSLDIQRNLVVPCVTDISGLVNFECDLLVLSKSGYATGIEIKVTKSDLKNDLSKNHIVRLNDLLWKSYSRKPALEYYYSPFKYYYYAVPEKLEEMALEQIPEFMGLYVIKKHPHVSKNIIVEVRKPKKLFNYRWSESQRYDLARLGTMRLLGLKLNIEKLK